MVKARTHNQITAGAYAAANMPVNSVAPTVTGATTNGSTLTCAPGTWSNTPTYAYQWNRAGNPIAGATAATRVLAAGDVGFTLTCTVVASKNNTQGVATSAPTATIT